MIKTALSGSRGVDQKRIAEAGLKIVEFVLKKNADYGSSAFQAPLLVPDMPADTAIKVRMSDKLQRIPSLARKAAEVDESMDDTFADLFGYWVLSKAMPKVAEKAPAKKAAERKRQSQPWVVVDFSKAVEPNNSQAAT